jgi:acetyl esterase/lipase
MPLRTLLNRAAGPALALLAALPGCAPVDLLNATVSKRGLAVERAIAYGPEPRQALDIWRPAPSATGSAAPLPVVVFFYGGAWQEGARGDYAFVAADLARHGHVVVVPDYRVHPQARYPAFLQDAAAAIAAARRLAPHHGGDPARLVLMGHSAGAHIAAMLALDPRWLAEVGEDRSRIAGLVGLAGPYDFLPIERPDIIEVFAPAPDPLETQPVTFADRNAPPALLLHGTADTTVLPRNSQSLAARLAEAGVPATLRLYEGVGHVGIVLGFARATRGASPALQDAAGFIAALPPRS